MMEHDYERTDEGCKDDPCPCACHEDDYWDDDYWGR